MPRDKWRAEMQDKGWELDRMKNIPGLVAAWEKYPGKDWYFMVDDDTWVNLHHLAELLSPLNVSEPLYLGNRYVISGKGCTTDAGACGPRIADELILHPAAILPW